MGAPDEFHPDAHPEARKITGDRDYGEWGQCISQASSTDERCRGYAKGPHGKCYHHGGADGSGGQEGNTNAEGHGAPEDNTNAVKHALFVERSRFYRKVMDNLDRRVCDDIYRERIEEYREKNGEPSTGDLDVMWQIAVEHIHITHSDNWLADRPASLRSGNAMVDRETRYTAEGREYHKYKEAVTVSTKLKLRKEHRAWLKDNNMLNDPDSQQAEAIGDLSSIILAEST